MGKNVSFRAGMGYGWRTNYNQRIYVWDKNTDVYIWEDEDGTDHYFEKQSDGTFKDEDGLELTLTDTGSGTEKYIIENKNGNKAYFDTSGRLTKISNNQETVSSITVSYTSADSLLIATVTDGVGRVYHYTYNTDNLLTCLSYRGTGMTDLFAVTYAYTDGMLTALTEPGGEMVSYSYNTDYHYLTSATDIDGYKITYEYTQLAADKPSRVSRVQEFDGTASGGVLTIAYGMNETTFTDKLGNVQILQFNNWGNTKSIQDGEGRAQFAQYATDKSDTGKGNQLTLSSKLQNTVVNLLTDSSFESSTLWTPDLATPTMTYSIASSGYLGSKSMQIAGCSAEFLCSPTFTVGAGETYTFSGYVKTTAGTAKLGIRNQDVQEDAVYSDAVSTDGEWVRVQVSYTNDTESAKTLYACFMGLENATAMIDCVQLEKAPTASRYNLVNNGDFRNGTTGWTGSGLAAGDGTAVYTYGENEQDQTPQLDDNVFKITGAYEAGKSLSQTIPVSGTAGDSYVVSGWAKGNSAALTCFDGQERDFGIRLTFHYAESDEELSEEEAAKRAPISVSFNADVKSDVHWQYAASAAVAAADYTAITVELIYNNNANTMYFDGIQLFKEAFGTSYTYDPETGNVVSVIDLQNKETTYEYDGNDLTKIMQDDKVKMTYTYDDWHNVETATTEEGLSFAFEYDTFGNNTKVSIVSDDVTISSSADYTDDGNRLESVTDALGNTTIYSYNADTNVLEWVQYPEDTEATRTTYTYDNMYRMATAAATTDTGLAMSASYSYTDDYLTQIQTPSTTYNFSYGDFGLRESVKVGTQNLATYDYDSHNRLKKLDYGNQDSVEYTYDTQGRVTQELYEDGATVTYFYDNTGALATVTDSATGITTTYYYDLIDRLVKYEEKGTDFSHSVTYIYDEKNNLSSLTEIINGVKTIYSYAYDDDNRVTSVTVGNGTTVISSVTYTYDAFGRISNQVTKHGDNTVFNKTITFNPGNEENSTSGQVANYDGFIYTYDDNGNILSAHDRLFDTTYEYDSANQLIRENNHMLEITQTWTYDNAGNILTHKQYDYTTGSLDGVTPTDTVNYTYGNSNWGDQLTVYDGAAITYDQIGNPLTDGTWTYTWEHGRQLASMEKADGTKWEYTYNASGMRTKRESEDTTYSYVYNGSQLVQMTVGDKTVNFTYDASGRPFSMIYMDQVFYYWLNLQGDVVGIFNSENTLVAEYFYDAWGNNGYVLEYSDDNLAALNPLRYRGYVYDTETGLYYLQSRYYDPEIGRFINADIYTTTGQGFTGNNMFAYCLNNPIRFLDPTGTVVAEITISAAGIVAVVICGVALVYCSVMFLDTLLDWLSSLWYYPSLQITYISESSTEEIQDETHLSAAYATPTPDDFDDDDDYYDNEENFGGKQKIGKTKGKAPQSNQAQNKQFAQATKDLSKDEQKIVHRMISGRGLGYHEIAEIAKELFVYFIIEGILRCPTERGGRILH